METIMGRDGVDLHLEGQGEQTLVMIHGWPDDYRLWDRQVAAFKSRYRCVRFSLPGFERGQPRQLRNMRQMLTALDSAIAQASPDKPVTLLLHDWGCFYGYQYAMRFPERVSRIIAVDVGDSGSRDHQLTARAKAMAAAYQLYLALSWKLGSFLGNPLTRMLAKALGAPAARSDIHSGMNFPYYWLWKGLLTGGKLGIRPVELTQPTLFLYGRNKPFHFHSQAWLERLNATPGSAVVEMETGHWVMVEQPERFNAQVLAWLEGECPQQVA
ncbi:alpha/beta hydrolase [Ferrimonas sediminicola]|uniref:Alpha/beta hydrolase n=1 Tax=Ferrimonas sediminicola TaxID=2569538 RepID=A0A4U1BHJ8_9GAMM|nr:alpha/beta hydrolase [Ferrimonas sediminicola]TKB50534.1 alpha/beta hydrolase [Ferrimonas sediminicola]